MIEKTRGIVLHQIKYNDSVIVVQLLTKKFGRQSFIIKGMRNKKAGKHNVLFQPISILDLVMYYKTSREIQALKEFSVSYTPYDIYSNIKKSCVAIFLAEVLTSVIKEVSPNENLFNYIEESIIYFDKCKDGFANFHIAFLTSLTSFLGFEPGPRTSKDDLFFDMKNGIFVPVPPVHSEYANSEVSNILADFISASYSSISNIILSGEQRNEVIEILTKYYSLHLPGLRKLKSLEVLKEVFR